MIMMAHEQIYAHYQQFSTETSEDLGIEKGLTFLCFCHTCFWNYTPQYKTLRLTLLGNTLLQKMYESWHFTLDAEDLPLLSQGKILLHLHKTFTSPYAWDRKKFYVYHSEPALMYEMVSRDFPAWLRSI